MKKIFFFVLLSVTLQNVTAQLQTNLVVSPTPPSTLTEWGNRKEVLTYMVQPSAGQQFSYKIKTEIKLNDGTVIGRTDLAKAATYTAASTNSIYYAPDVIPLQYMLFTGKYKTALEKTGKLPADNYMLCVRLVRPVDFTPVSEEKCRSFYLASLQLPILMKPAREEVLDATVANQVITFRWAPVVPRPSLPVTYRLRVMEVLPNQSPMQAFRSNQPILDKDVKGTTQYIWQVQGIINCCSVLDSITAIPITREVKLPDDQSGGVIVTAKCYVWTIQSLDNTGKPLGDGNINGDGVSEPAFFFVALKNKAKL